MLIAGDAAQETDLARLDQRIAGLPEGERGFLRHVPQLKGMVSEIALQQRRLAEVTAPAFREPLANSLVQEIEAFSSRISGLRYPLAEGFRSAAAAWLEVARRQREEARRPRRRNSRSRSISRGRPGRPGARGVRAADGRHRGAAGPGDAAAWLSRPAPLRAAEDGQVDAHPQPAAVPTHQRPRDRNSRCTTREPSPR